MVWKKAISTATMTTTSLLELLYDALHQPLGIVVETNSPERLRQKLYALRKAHEPVFDNLAFLISPTEPSTQVWIVKKEIPSATDSRDRET